MRAITCILPWKSYHPRRIDNVGNKVNLSELDYLMLCTFNSGVVDRRKGAVDKPCNHAGFSHRSRTQHSHFAGDHGNRTLFCCCGHTPTQVVPQAGTTSPSLLMGANQLPAVEETSKPSAGRNFKEHLASSDSIQITAQKKFESCYNMQDQQ